MADCMTHARTNDRFLACRQLPRFKIQLHRIRQHVQCNIWWHFASIQVTFSQLACTQGGPSGRGTLFVDIKFKVPPQYRADGVDGRQEMERNLAAARHSWARQQAWLLLSFHFLLGNLCPQAVQGGWGGWPTGNGKKLSNSQACCLAQLCLVAA